MYIATSVRLGDCRSNILPCREKGYLYSERLKAANDGDPWVYFENIDSVSPLVVLDEQLKRWNNEANLVDKMQT